MPPSSKLPHSTPTPNNNQPSPTHNIVTDSPSYVIDDSTTSIAVVSQEGIHKRNSIKYILTAGILGAILLAVAVWLYPQVLNHNNLKFHSGTTIPQTPFIVNSLVEIPNKSKTTTNTEDERCRKGDIMRPTKSDFFNPTPKTNKERRNELKKVVPPFYGAAKVEDGTLLQQFIGGYYKDEENEISAVGLVDVYETMAQEIHKITTPFNTNKDLMIWDDLLMKNMGTKKCIYCCELSDDVPKFMKIGRCTNAKNSYCSRYAIDEKQCLAGVPVDGDPNCRCMFSLDDTVKEDRQPAVNLLKSVLDVYPVNFEKVYKELELGTAISAEAETGLSIFFAFIVHLFLGPGRDSYFEGGESVESLATGVFMNVYESMMQQVVELAGFGIKGVMHEMFQSPLLQYVEKKLIPELNGAIERRLKNMNLIHVEFPKRVPTTKWPVPKHLREVAVSSYTYVSTWEPSYDTSPPEGLDDKEDQDKYGYVHNEDDEEDEKTTSSTTLAGFVRDGSQIPLTPLLYDMTFQIWDSKDTINPTYEPEYQIKYWTNLLDNKGASVHDPSLVYEDEDIKKALFDLETFLDEFEKTRGNPFFQAWETRIDRNSFVFKHKSYDVVTLLEERGYIVYDRFEGSVEVWKENDECQNFYIEVHPAPWPAFGSYPNGGPGSRLPYSMIEHATHLSRALETALAIAMATGFREGGLDPKKPFEAGIKIFGNVITAWAFRTFCIRNAHFSTRACALISKVMMAVHLLDGEDLHPLAMSNIKNMFVSQKERNYARRGGIGGQSGMAREMDLADKFRAIFSIPGMYGDWGEGNDKCTTGVVDEFAEFLVSQIEKNVGHFEQWLVGTMSKKFAPCVVEEIRKAYTDANDYQSSRAREDEQKSKAREERRRSGSYNQRN